MHDLQMIFEGTLIISLENHKYPSNRLSETKIILNHHKVLILHPWESAVKSVCYCEHAQRAC